MEVKAINNSLNVLNFEGKNKRHNNKQTTNHYSKTYFKRFK